MTALRALLDRLDAAEATVESLTVHNPDLDDVLLALTGQPAPSTTTREEASPS